MMGQKIKCGTNNSELLIDEQKLYELMEDDSDDDTYDDIEETNIEVLFNSIEQDTKYDSDCDDEDFKFSFE